MTRRRASAPDRHCQALMARLSRYVDAELTDADCRRLEQHLRGCAACTNALKGLRRTLQSCRRARQTPLPAAVRRRARARIRALLGDA